MFPYLSHGKHGNMEDNNGRKNWKQSNGDGIISENHGKILWENRGIAMG